MSKLLTVLLIIGAWGGLEAAHHCKCKPKVTKEQKHENKKAHKEGLERAKEDMRHLDKMDKCFCDGVFQTIPADKVLVKVKRDANGDRV